MKPIIFSTEMVKAILDGRKSQTRRIIKPQPHSLLGRAWVWAFKKGKLVTKGYWLDHCPYGQVGDQLWVRETHAIAPISKEVVYLADVGKEYIDLLWRGAYWRPSIHMFRKDSRITLEITEVRVERFNVATMTAYELTLEGGDPALKLLTELYDGKWVWVISFKRIDS